eukprot:CAMPEP_0185853728 /NCGR_PEP_ID=MMETSP1354-20130828/19991_1 /TAXON_ID=708628 /ORGANISM="Erythrolobus madagascarensis, Strain CCMP3276" /LENGTH=36 /DNA_ID= /DNA_START= /DNA_END= /DNA_ORIENTATION=
MEKSLCEETEAVFNASGFEDGRHTSRTVDNAVRIGK